MDPAESSSPATGRPRRGLTALLVAVIAAGLLLAGGGLAVAFGIGRTDTPTATSVDAGFSRDMSRHHLQAVEMANLAVTRSDDALVRQLAFDISSTQTNQAGRMQGWLTLWGLPITGGDTMAWMGSAGHDGHGDTSMTGMSMTGGGLMPGMATEDELRSLTGTAFDVRFLQLMTRHHQGGLAMAQYGEEHASVPAVRGLAHSIAETQSAETQTMTDMLAARGAAPLPTP